MNTQFSLLLIKVNFLQEKISTFLRYPSVCFKTDEKRFRAKQNDSHRFFQTKGCGQKPSSYTKDAELCTDTLSFKSWTLRLVLFYPI